MKRTSDSERRIELVVKAARKLFVEKGYYSVSIPQIVKASGVSTGAIYHYFSSKEALALYIHEQALDEFKRQFSHALLGKKTACEKLKAFAEMVFGMTESDAVMMAYMLLMQHGEFLQESRPLCSTEPFRMVQQIVAQGIDSGEIRQGNYFLSAVSYTGVILRAVDLRLQGVLEEPLTESAGELIGNAWASIKA